MYGQRFYEELLDKIMMVGHEKSYRHVSGAELGELMADSDMQIKIAYAITDELYQKALKKEVVAK